jgi:hypothetical protein
MKVQNIGFDLGQIVMTIGAREAFEAAQNHPDNPANYLVCHAAGDWGDVCADDAKENDYSLLHNLRILSSYRLKDQTKIWIITEADRSVTTILLPEEY